MPSGWGKAASYMGLAFVIPVSMYICYQIGNYLQPAWGGVVGLMVGLAAGLYESYRQAMEFEKRNGGKP
jgi:Putative F0F1-ATPase subunit Ca2+/Mg2+ transporter